MKSEVFLIADVAETRGMTYFFMLQFFMQVVYVSQTLFFRNLLHSGFEIYQNNSLSKLFTFSTAAPFILLQKCNTGQREVYFMYDNIRKVQASKLLHVRKKPKFYALWSFIFFSVSIIMEKRTKIRFTSEEATQYILDLPSDSDMSDLEDSSSDEEADAKEIRNEPMEIDNDVDTRNDDGDTGIDVE